MSHIEVTTTVSQQQPTTAQPVSSTIQTMTQQMPTTSSMSQPGTSHQMDTNYSIMTSQFQQPFQVPIFTSSTPQQMVSTHNYQPMVVPPHSQYIPNMYQYGQGQPFQLQFSTNSVPPVTNNNPSITSRPSTPNPANLQSLVTNVTKTPIVTSTSRSTIQFNAQNKKNLPATNTAEFLKETLDMASGLGGNITTARKSQVIDAINFALNLFLENAELKEQIKSASKRKRYDTDVDPRDDITMDDDNEYVTKAELKSCMDEIKNSINNLTKVFSKQNGATTSNQQNKMPTFAEIIKENKKTTVERHQTVVYLPENEDTSITRQTLAQLIQPAKEGIAMTDAKSLSKGKMIINFKDKESKNKFELLAKATKKINTEPPRKLRPSIMLKGVRLDVKKENIPSMFESFNYPIALHVNRNQLDITKLVEVVAEKKNFRNDMLINYVISIDPAIRDIVINEMNGKIILDYALVHAEDMSPLRQCYRCYGFNHIANTCQLRPEQQVCHHCALMHKFEQCPNKTSPQRCVNCRKTGAKDVNSHNSVSKSCPVYVRMLQRVADKVEYYSHV